MPDEVMLGDAPVELEAPAETTEEAVAEPLESGQESTEVQPKTELKIDDKTPLWKQEQIKTELAKVSPQAAALIKQKLIALDNVDAQLKDFGGVKGVVAVQTAIKGLANAEGQTAEQILTETATERAYFRGIDDLFTKSDPKFAETLNDAAPDKFDAMVPHILTKWSQTNPTEFSRSVANVAVSDMNEQGIPLQFRILASFVPRLPEGPEKTEIVNAVNELHAWTKRMEGFKNAEKKTVEGKKPEGQVQSSKSPEDQALDATRTTWIASAYPTAVNLFKTELAKVGKADADQESKILTKVAEEFDAVFARDQKYSRDMDGFLKQGDRAGFIRRLNSEQGQKMAGAVRRAYDAVVVGTQKAKPAAVKPATNGSTVTRLSTEPTDIDWRRTSNQMYDRGEAYRKGQQEVTRFKR